MSQSHHQPKGTKLPVLNVLVSLEYHPVVAAHHLTRQKNKSKTDKLIRSKALTVNIFYKLPDVCFLNPPAWTSQSVSHGKNK